MIEIEQNDIFLITLKAEDKAKFYHHAAKNDIKINLSKQPDERLFVGVYMPPKSIIKGNPIVDRDLISNFYNFLDALDSNKIEYLIRVYEKKYTIDMINRKQKPYA